jgi:hypothetical protein
MHGATVKKKTALSQLFGWKALQLNCFGMGSSGQECGLDKKSAVLKSFTPTKF